MGLFLASKLVEVVHQHLDLRGRGPVLHFDAVDDRVLLHVIFVLLNVRLVEVDRQRDMAARTVGSVTIEGTHIVFGAFAAKFVVAARADGLFGGFITDAADEDVLASLGVLFEDEVGMIGDLTHLHDKTENVGVIVQHHTPTDVGIELACRV